MATPAARRRRRYYLIVPPLAVGTALWSSRRFLETQFAADAQRGWMWLAAIASATVVVALIATAIALRIAERRDRAFYSRVRTAGGVFAIESQTTAELRAGLQRARPDLDFDRIPRRVALVANTKGVRLLRVGEDAPPLVAFGWRELGPSTSASGAHLTDSVDPRTLFAQGAGDRVLVVNVQRATETIPLTFTISRLVLRPPQKPAATGMAAILDVLNTTRELGLFLMDQNHVSQPASERNRVAFGPPDLRLLRGPSAYSLSRFLLAMALVGAVLGVAGWVVVSLNDDLSRQLRALIGGFGVIVAVASLFAWGLLVPRRERAEVKRRYTTLNGVHLELPQLHPTTKAVIRPASAPRLSRAQFADARAERFS